MKALLDEQLSPDIAVILRDRGHDVVAVVERDDLLARSDRTIMTVAAEESRAVVTNNIKDFRALAAEWLTHGRSHGGLILVPSTRSRTKAATLVLVDTIEGVLHESSDGLTSSERWLDPLR